MATVSAEPELGQLSFRDTCNSRDEREPEKEMRMIRTKHQTITMCCFNYVYLINYLNHEHRVTISQFMFH